MLAVGLPVFCAGLTPNSPVRNGPGTVGLPVVVGGVRIESGDVLLGDNDGVVVIPRAELAGVNQADWTTVRKAEASLEAKVKLVWACRTSSNPFSSPTRFVASPDIPEALARAGMN